MASIEIGTESVNTDDDFDQFYRQVEPRLRRALTATYGSEVGREATAEALAWAWEHRERLRTLTNPTAFLYRVGQSRVRRRRTPFFRPRFEWHEAWIEPELASALAKLSDRQRTAVVLIHGYEWTSREVAELLNIKFTTVQNHLARGLLALRAYLEVDTHD